MPGCTEIKTRKQDARTALSPLTCSSTVERIPVEDVVTGSNPVTIPAQSGNSLKAQGSRPKEVRVKPIKGARGKGARMEHGKTVNVLRQVTFACLFGTSEASRMGQA